MKAPTTRRGPKRLRANALRLFVARMSRLSSAQAFSQTIEMFSVHVDGEHLLIPVDAALAEISDHRGRWRETLSAHRRTAAEPMARRVPVATRCKTQPPFLVSIG